MCNCSTVYAAMYIYPNNYTAAMYSYSNICNYMKYTITYIALYNYSTIYTVIYYYSTEYMAATYNYLIL